MSAHRGFAVGLVLVLVLLSAASVFRLHYEEDIAAFLPIDTRDESQKELVSSLSEQRTVSVIFRYEGTAEGDDAVDYVTGAMDFFESAWFEVDTAYLVPEMSATVDQSQALDLLEFVQGHYPSFLTAADFTRMDSLLSQPGYIREQMEYNRRQMLSPTGGFMTETLTSDPLHLFTPVLQRMAELGNSTGYRMVDGHVVHASRPIGLLFFDSPFGESESRLNAGLSRMVSQAGDLVREEYPDVKISAVGSPILAASNANRIKTDSIIAVALAVIGIFLVLWFSFRSFKDILWIAVSLLSGGLFSLGIIGLFRDSISIIVVGIGSVIVGIAANYPLHFLHYLRDCGDSRRTVRDMVQPLLTGNITTVSAFLCLIFLKARAMHDLALFGGIMLIGTILFVMIFLPVFVNRRNSEADTIQADASAATVKSSGRSFTRIVSWAVMVITLVMVIWGGSASFDTDLHGINYMTRQQKEDLALLTEGMEDAMPSPLSAVATLLPTAAEQQAEEGLWEQFWKEHSEVLDELDTEARACGFASGAFDGFKASALDIPQLVSREDLAPVEMSALMAQLVESLSQDFNMVLFLCGFIVFAFLWVSFGSLELALLSFLPLTVGWIWILGIMDLLGIQFNIVSIILATFIFGQGDDYTIFITEGLMHEYAYGEKTLADRRKSVLISAVIMFIGIGTLIIARHPAMRSLAEITMIGMSVVVLMAHFLPEWVFRWLTEKKGRLRDVPVTLARLGRSVFAFGFFLLAVIVVTPAALLIFIGGKREWKERWLHGVLYRFSNLVIRRVPGVKFFMDNSVGEFFEKPAVVVCNHQSHLDLMCLLMFTPKMVVVTNDWVWRNPFYGALIRRAEFIPAADGTDAFMPQLRSLVERGYSIAVYPEGTRSVDCSIQRFHKGAFHIAEQLGLDIVPVFLHGVGHVLPKEDFMLRKGSIHVRVGERIAAGDPAWGADARECTKAVHRMYIDRYAAMCREIEDWRYWKNYVESKYLYKGSDILSRCRSVLKSLDGSEPGLGTLPSDLKELVLEDCGQGETAWLAALVHPDVEITAKITNAEDYALASASQGIPRNLHFVLG